LPKCRVDRLEPREEQPHGPVEVKLELAGDVRVERVDDGYVNPPRARILPHRQRPEPFA
jgi:hypothetical protein